MPEALARSDHDFVVSSYREPVAARRPAQKNADNRSGAPRRAARPARATWRKILHYIAAQPGRNIAFGAIAAIALGIIVNALAMQKMRHPAPLFLLPNSAALSLAPNALPSPPMPAPRPADLAALVPDQPGKLIAPHVLPGKTLRPIADPIADLLRPQGGVGASAGAITEAGKSVVLAQQALVKLGFVLKPDGVLGGTTRQAIERFERDQGLPVTGDLTPRIKRELSAQSGILVK